MGKIHKVIRIEDEGCRSTQRSVVEEFPLRIRINGCDLVTLVCSPHRLNELLVGFLRTQALVSAFDDILMLGICEESGLAEVRIRGIVPVSLQPTLTSGCGTGVSYNLPDELPIESGTARNHLSCGLLVRLMKELQEKSVNYLEHGGIHAAAIGDESGLLILSEDLGRHNAIDRLAGQAWFTQLSVRDRILITSGRVSSEVAVKAHRLGIALIASRTSPTDRAIELCRQAGITLIGYLRGRRMEIYSHPERLRASGDTGEQSTAARG